MGEIGAWKKKEGAEGRNNCEREKMKEAAGRKVAGEMLFLCE
jgi:hypothetical protein